MDGETLRVALTSDLHIGERVKAKAIIRVFQEINTYRPDLYMNLGDNSGGLLGYRATNTICKMETNILDSSITKAGCQGNHDYWLCRSAMPRHSRKHGTHPFPCEWEEALGKIATSYRENNVHFFNEDGPLRKKGWTFVGHSMWYFNLRPIDSNDWKYLPRNIETDTGKYLFKTSYRKLWNNIDLLTAQDTKVVICSHFPLTGPHFDANSCLVNEHSSLAQSLISHYHAKAFFNGHMHQQHLGPWRYEAGSNRIVGFGDFKRYDHPRFLILDLKPEGKIEVAHADP